MIPSDLELARIELDSYAVTPAGQVVDCGLDRAVVTHLPDCTVVSIKGTTTPGQWLSNFKSVGVVPKEHPQLGDCESGFLDGAMMLWPYLTPALSVPPVVLQGHSRGAGMVPILAALMLLAGIKPARVVMWESPWCVGALCKKILLDAEVDGIQYWHGDDPVPCVPAVPWLCPHVWPIKHFGAWQLDALACHSMAGIVATLSG